MTVNLVRKKSQGYSSDLFFSYFLRKRTSELRVLKITSSLNKERKRKKKKKKVQIISAQMFQKKQPNKANVIIVSIVSQSHTFRSEHTPSHPTQVKMFQLLNLPLSTKQKSKNPILQNTYFPLQNVSLTSFNHLPLTSTESRSNYFPLEQFPSYTNVRL